MIATLITAFAIVIGMKFLQQAMLNWIMPDVDTATNKPKSETIS